MDSIRLSFDLEFTALDAQYFQQDAFHGDCAAFNGLNLMKALNIPNFTPLKKRVPRGEVGHTRTSSSLRRRRSCCDPENSVSFYFSRAASPEPEPPDTGSPLLRYPLHTFRKTLGHLRYFFA